MVSKITISEISPLHWFYLFLSYLYPLRKSSMLTQNILIFYFITTGKHFLFFSVIIHYSQFIVICIDIFKEQIFMKKKSSIILHSLFFVICSVLAVLFLYHIISIRRLNVKYTPAMTEESSLELDNPYRGFYQLSGYILSDNQKPEKSAAWCRKSCASNPYPLMLLEINLKNYSNTSISTNAKNQLDKILEECVRAKKQVMLLILFRAFSSSCILRYILISSNSVGQIGMNRCSGKTCEFHNLRNLFSQLMQIIDLCTYI